MREDKLKINTELATIIDHVVQDCNIPLLMDRQFPNTIRSRLGFWVKKEYCPRSQLNYLALCIEWTVRAYHKLLLERPRFLLSPSYPHQAEWYVRLKTAELMDIPVYVLHSSRIRHYYKLHKGLERSADPIIIDSDTAVSYIEDAKGYIERCNASYQAAIPDYELARLNRNRGRYVWLPTLAKKFWSRPSWIFNTMVCWKELRLRSVHLNHVGALPFAIFYLHYQPERTTLPEAFGFTQQIRAIARLRAVLPDHVLLLVKEHPSTFTNQCSPFARDVNFYQTIDLIDGVRFVDIATDNFDLIDKSVFTATIGGTVNTESLLRGRPTVVFGTEKYTETCGQHFYKNDGALSDFIRSVIDNEFTEKNVVSEVSRQIFDEQRYVVRFEPSESSSVRKKYIEECLSRSYGMK